MIDTYSKRDTRHSKQGRKVSKSRHQRIKSATFGKENKCAHCPHGSEGHKWVSTQPYFFTTDRRVSKNGSQFYVEDIPTPLYKGVVCQEAILQELYCNQCAEENNTHQITCYTRRWGVGEIV